MISVAARFRACRILGDARGSAAGFRGEKAGQAEQAQQRLPACGVRPQKMIATCAQAVTADSASPSAEPDGSGNGASQPAAVSAARSSSADAAGCRGRLDGIADTVTVVLLQKVAQERREQLRDETPRAPVPQAVTARTACTSRCGYPAGGVTDRWVCACVLKYSAMTALAAL
jgi:hypothetical protein